MNSIHHLEKEFFSFLTQTFNLTAENLKPITFTLNADDQKVAFGDITSNAALMLAKDTNRVLTGKDVLKLERKGLTFNFADRNYKNQAEYDSFQKTLPAARRDGWFKRRLTKKQIEINKKYSENLDEIGKKLVESILHRLPYMLFVSLPLFALILKLLYIRRKQFYYADHGIFTIHLYIFSFYLSYQEFYF